MKMSSYLPEKRLSLCAWVQLLFEGQSWGEKSIFSTVKFGRRKKNFYE